MMLSALEFRNRFVAIVSVVLTATTVPVVSAQRTVDSGVLEFAFPEGRTLMEAEAWVIQQARIEALKQAFGMRIAIETVQVQSEYNGRVDDAFTELSVEQVKGEWMEDKSIEGPDRICRDGDFWFQVRVTGKARRNREGDVALELTLVEDVLCHNETETLADGDRVRLRFWSPIDGHVMFFYLEDGQVYALSGSQSEMATAVNGQRVYSLFSTESEWIAADAGLTTLERLPRYSFGFQVTGKEAVESRAVILAAFAQTSFAPPRLDYDDKEKVWTMGEEDFERWVKQNMARTPLFQVERQAARIRPQQRY